MHYIFYHIKGNGSLIHWLITTSFASYFLKVSCEKSKALVDKVIIFVWGVVLKDNFEFTGTVLIYVPSCFFFF